MKKIEKNRKKSKKKDKNRKIKIISMWKTMWKIQSTRIKNKTI